MPIESETRIVAGGITFAVEHRHFGGDEGPAVRVLGDRGGRETQLLRFDCFVKDPHYHYDPDGKNIILHMSPEFDSIAWSVDHLERNVKIMIRLAGYPDLAETIDTDAIVAAMPALRRAMSGK